MQLWYQWMDSPSASFFPEPFLLFPLRFYFVVIPQALTFGRGGSLLEGPQGLREGGLRTRALTVLFPQQTFTPKLVLLDLADISCVPDVAKEVLDCYGCVDILINNASMKIKGPAHKISLELDKKIMDANYFGPITLTKGLVSLPFP